MREHQVSQAEVVEEVEQEGRRTLRKSRRAVLWACHSFGGGRYFQEKVVWWLSLFRDGQVS